MLLVIHNLPLHTCAQDVQSLVRARCGVGEMILDKLVRKTNNSQSVTIGVANEREADAVMRSMNGYFLDGQQLRVEDMRTKNKPAGRSDRSDYYANDPYQNRGQRPGNYSNNQQTYRPPAPVKNPYEADRSRSITTMNPPALLSQTYTAFGMASTGASSLSQNTYMDFGNQRLGQQNSQFGSNQGGQNMGWNEGSSQYRLPSLMDQENTYMDYGNQQQPQQNLQFRYNLQGQNESWTESNNQYRLPSLMEQNFDPGPSKCDNDRQQPSAETVYNFFSKNDRKRVRSPDNEGLYSRDRRAANDNISYQFNQYKTKVFAEKSDPKDVLTNEHASNERDVRRRFSGVQSDLSDSFRYGEVSNSLKGNLTAERSSFDSRASEWQRKPYYEIHIDREDKYRNTQNSNSQGNEISTWSYKVDQKLQNSNSRWNEPRQQSLETEQSTQNSGSRWNQNSIRSYKVDRKTQNLNNRRNEPRDQSPETERNTQNAISRWNETSTRSYKVDRKPQYSDSRWNKPREQSSKTERCTQNFNNPWKETSTGSSKIDRNAQRSYSQWNETLQQAFETERNPQKSINPWNETPRQSYTTEQFKKSISIWNQTPQQFFEADLNLRKGINVRDETPYQPFTTDPDIPARKGDEGKLSKLAVSHERDPQSIHKARKLRNIAVMSIAKEIIDARLNFELGKKKFIAAAAGARRLLKAQVDDVIKCEYPREKFAIVPVEEIIKLYRRKFTAKDDDELFNRTFMSGKKANTLGLARKIAKGSPAIPNKQQGGQRLAPYRAPAKKSKKAKASGVKIIQVFMHSNKPTAPGVKPSSTPSSQMPSTNPIVIQVNPKNPGVGISHSNPDKLPQYINGDKKQSIQQKQLTKREFLDDEVYKCSPELEKALDLELEDLRNLYVLACETSDEDEKDVAKLICDNSFPEFNKTIRLHLTKRLMNIKSNLVVRIFVNGRAPGRSEVEEALKPFGVYILKKCSQAKFMYVATCDSYESYDKLCAAGEIPAKVKGEDTILLPKPFQLTMPYKFRRQLNKFTQKQKPLLNQRLIDGMEVCEDNDDGIYDDGTGGTDDDDVQIIETAKGNITESIVIDDANDDVVVVSDDVVKSKTEEVGEKTQDNKCSDLPKDAVVHDDKNATVCDDKDAAVHDEGDDVDIDEADFDEDDLEDY